tara:strand:- start:1195 stop:1572 length:378 start_codon:yes stop_codon:yes gene_type:complete
MTTLSREQLEAMDSIKVLNTLLSKADHSVITTAKDNQWTIKISTLEFTMTLRYWMSESPLDVLGQGVRTWSMTVKNSRGKNVMSSSDLTPQVSSEMGRIISKNELRKSQYDSQGDWAELEKYASL